MNKDQIVFFDEIKSKIGDHKSLVYDLSDLLGISMDSTYRRLRAETPLTFNEVQILCKHYGISFDSFCNIQSDNIMFQYKSLVDASNDIFSCFQKIVKDVQLISTCKESQMISAASDIPSFQLFKHPELTAFRLHNWVYNMLKHDSNDEKPADHDYKTLIEHADFKKTLQMIGKAYEAIPSVEVWTTDTISGMLKAIEFYYDSYLFSDKNDLLKLCHCLLDVLNNLFNTGNDNNLKLFISDIAIENNYILVQADDLRFVYLKLYSLNNIMTTNPSFCAETEVWLNNLISKSTLITGSAERVRKMFYMGNKKRVEKLMQRIEKGN